jgi:hypothetical protein
LALLQALHRKELLPSLSNLTSSIFACSNTEAFETGKQVHSLAVKAGCQFNSYVCNSLITMYGKCKNMEYVLHDIDEEQMESSLLHHSEKLAVAYGLVITHKGMPIQIMKNLRICGDCNTFIKFVSHVTKREIDIRDGNRFHHFSNGSCSCGDFWW